MVARRRVLIVCTGNSCRSQLAEALWRARWGEAWEVRSAGSEPTGAVHPRVPEVLAEKGIDATGHASEPLARAVDERFDLVVTVCDRARESCPRVLESVPQLHWPFPDPARFSEGVGGSDELAVFRAARDAIEARIVRYRDTVGAAEGMGTWLGQVLDLLPGPPPAARREAFSALVDDLVRTIATDGDPWNDLPRAIECHYEPFGWAWNGFYRLRGLAPRRRLELGPAAGPPVCATIEERPGGLGASGMCFDAILADHPVAAAEVARYPGYVSCDGESGLATVAGLAIPIVERGDPVGVWDLDATAPLDPSDPVLLGALLRRLPAVVPVPKGWRT